MSRCGMKSAFWPWDGREARHWSQPNKAPATPTTMLAISYMREPPRRRAGRGAILGNRTLRSSRRRQESTHEVGGERTENASNDFRPKGQHVVGGKEVGTDGKAEHDP